MLHVKKRIIGIMFISIVLLGLAVVAFAQTPGGRIVQNCTNSWTKIWSGKITIGNIHRGEYPVLFRGGSFASLNNVLEHGCQVEVVFAVDGGDITDIYQCQAATVSPQYFSCRYGGSERGTDASGVGTVVNPEIRIEEGITSAEYFLKTLGSSPKADYSITTFVPKAFSAVFGGSGEVIVFTKK